MRPSSSSSSRAVATTLAILLTIPHASAAVRVPFGFVVVVVPPHPTPTTTTTTTTTTTSVDDGLGRGPPPRGRPHYRRRHRHHRLASTFLDADFDVGRCCDEDDRSSGRNTPFDDDDEDVGGGNDGRSVGAGRGEKKASSSVATKKRRKAKNDEQCYWHDEDDHFFVVTDENSVYDGRGACGPRVGELQQRRWQNHNASDLLHNITDTDTANIEIIDGRIGSINDHDRRKRIKFTIRGNPRVLVRHRTARGFVYNPSRPAQESFRDALLGLLPSRFRPTVTDEDDEDEDDDDEEEDGIRRGGGGGGRSSSSPIVPAVLFSEGESLRLSIIFRMKRPASHFVASRRTGPSSRLKPAFSSAGGGLLQQVAAIRSDVDNLAKFVMDSLNGVLYVDDRQVVSLNVMKVLDSEGPCFGATEVEICVLREEDML